MRPLLRPGSPGGRPKGLARRVKEEFGHDGAGLVSFLAGVVADTEAKTTDRLEAARILLERGWGRPAITVADGETPTQFMIVSAFATNRDGTIEDLAA